MDTVHAKHLSRQTNIKKCKSPENRIETLYYIVMINWRAQPASHPKVTRTPWPRHLGAVIDADFAVNTTSCQERAAPGQGTHQPRGIVQRSQDGKVLGMDTARRRSQPWDEVQKQFRET